MNKQASTSAPAKKYMAYCCTLPDCNPFIFSEINCVVLPVAFIKPSTTFLSNQAAWRPIKLKMIFLIMELKI